MDRKIKIFKSFEEQEAYHKECMHNTTPEQRFRMLYEMQQWTNLFHTKTKEQRKITIHYGYLKQ